MTNLPYNGNFKIILEYGAQHINLWSGDSIHRGIDFAGVGGLKISSSVCGTVEFAGDSCGRLGRLVVIRETGTEYRHYFCHLANIKVRLGAYVTQRTLIGTEGATGSAVTRHLHYEIRSLSSDSYANINPAEYLHIPNLRGIYHAPRFSSP